jgi:hypothetical protein
MVTTASRNPTTRNDKPLNSSREISPSPSSSSSWHNSDTSSTVSLQPKRSRASMNSSTVIVPLLSSCAHSTFVVVSKRTARKRQACVLHRTCRTLFQSVPPGTLPCHPIPVDEKRVSFLQMRGLTNKYRSCHPGHELELGHFTVSIFVQFYNTRPTINICEPWRNSDLTVEHALGFVVVHDPTQGTHKHLQFFGFDGPTTVAANSN